jgi:hypothetical protein
MHDTAIVKLWNSVCDKEDKVSEMEVFNVNQVISHANVHYIHTAVGALLERVHALINWKDPASSSKAVVILWLLGYVGRLVSHDKLIDVTFFTLMSVPALYRGNQTYIETLVKKNMQVFLMNARIKLLEVFFSVYPKVKKISGSSPKGSS